MRLCLSCVCTSKLFLLLANYGISLWEVEYFFQISWMNFRNLTSEVPFRMKNNHLNRFKNVGEIALNSCTLKLKHTEELRRINIARLISLVDYF